MSTTISPHGGLTRRKFLKTTGIATGVMIASGTSISPLLAMAEDAAIQKREEKTVPGRCFFGGCFSCSYQVKVRDNHAVKVVPNPDAPYGRRPCLRGISQIQRLYSADRIKYPMKRAGERGSGEWERISWDEAISIIAEKWAGYIEEFGSQSVALSNASGGARFMPLVRSRFANIMQLTTLDLSCDWAFYSGLHRVYGNPATGIMTTPCNEPFEEDVFSAKTIMLWGHNLSEAYLQRWRYVLEAQEKGATIVAIDPNQTLTATRADA